MGISLESWREQLGRWERRRSQSPQKAKGISGLLQKMHWNGAIPHIFILIAAFIHAFKSLQESLLRKSTANQMELFVVQLVLCLSARISEIASNLIHDIETNPGPCMNQVTKVISAFCLHFHFQGVCPGDGVLGPQPSAFYKTNEDPLERMLRGSTFTFGGASRYINSLETAIDAFIHREYPYLQDVSKQQGLAIVPSLPSADTDITWEELSKHCISQRHGGLLQGDLTLKRSTFTLPKSQTDSPFWWGEWLCNQNMFLIDFVQVTRPHKALIKWIQWRRRSL